MLFDSLINYLNPSFRREISESVGQWISKSEEQRTMIPMGHEVGSLVTQADRELKVFGSPETFFQKGFWPSETMRN
jgi:hypothetical protein